MAKGTTAWVNIVGIRCGATYRSNVSENVTGTTIRNIQARARSSVEARQDVLRRPARRIVGWALSKAIKLGLLPASEDWYRWDFTMPPKLSIDPRNDSKTQADEYKLGAVNMTGILQEKGKTPLYPQILATLQQISCPICFCLNLHQRRVSNLAFSMNLRNVRVMCLIF